MGSWPEDIEKRATIKQRIAFWIFKKMDVVEQFETCMVLKSKEPTMNEVIEEKHRRFEKIDKMIQRAIAKQERKQNKKK